MKYCLLFQLIMLLQLPAVAQNAPTEEARPIVEEGKKLYRSEMASWYGTDVFMSVYQDKANIGGYFSYTGPGIATCIFYSKSENPVVIGAISFDSTYAISTAKTDLTERAFSPEEADFYAMRKAATAAIGSDTLFKKYSNTNFNLIPIISAGVKKVYVLTGTSKQGVVIFGNDYLITFDKENNVTGKKALHRNIIPIRYDEKPEDGSTIEGAMHTHLPETGDFMTATDICTLMLFEKYAKWKQHNVISEKYLNVWNCITDQLVVVPLDVIEKINKDKEKKKKDNQD